MSCYPYVVPRSLISRRHFDPRWPLLHGADNRRSAAISIADAREQFVRSAAGIAADMFGPRGAYYGETVDQRGGVDRMPAGARWGDSAISPDRPHRPVVSARSRP